MLQFKGLKKETDNRAWLSNGKIIDYYTPQFEMTGSLRNHFTRKVGVNTSDIFPNDEIDGVFVIEDNQKSGLMSFRLIQETLFGTKSWQPRESIVSLIPEYKCVKVLVNDTVYHMHIENIQQYIPDGYALVEIQQRVEKLFVIIKEDEVVPNKEYLKQVGFPKNIVGFLHKRE